MSGAKNFDPVLCLQGLLPVFKVFSLHHYILGFQEYLIGKASMYTNSREQSGKWQLRYSMRSETFKTESP